LQEPVFPETVTRGTTPNWATTGDRNLFIPLIRLGRSPDLPDGDAQFFATTVVHVMPALARASTASVVASFRSFTCQTARHP
jgi:hypothetical protein